MIKPRCIVLVSKSGYSEEHAGLLEQWVNDGVKLFSAVGKDCERWEEAMDQVCVDLDYSGRMPGAFCTTTSHPDELVAEVIGFAEDWNNLRGLGGDVKVVEI